MWGTLDRDGSFAAKAFARNANEYAILEIQFFFFFASE